MITDQSYPGEKQNQVNLFIDVFYSMTGLSILCVIPVDWICMYYKANMPVNREKMIYMHISNKNIIQIQRQELRET